MKKIISSISNPSVSPSPRTRFCVGILKHEWICQRPIITAFLLLTALALSSCMMIDRPEGPLNLQPAEFTDLHRWENDSHRKALTAFRLSCEKDLLQKPAVTAIGPVLPDGRPLGGTALAWHEPCQSAILMLDGGSPVTDDDARRFFEEWFRPWEIRAGRDREGLFTGYFEPQLFGSRQRQRSYQTPLLARPDDLVMVQLGEFRGDLAGRRIAGRVKNGYLKPYESRADIESGKMPAESFKPIVWIDDPVDAFFLHIQGSGQVVLEDESVIRVGYAGQNGHPYYAIGTELLKRGALEKEDVSMQAIEQWLNDNPDQMEEVLNTNASYVFFRELEEGPVGAEGVVLTPGRSLAVDHTRLPYGTPVWLETEPVAPGYSGLRRLMIAQDTGGAIRGTIRGDVYWGAGEKAKFLAGNMKTKGRKWILLPLSVR